MIALSAINRAILFGEGMEAEVLRVREDNEGNFVILHIHLFDYDINLYGPNLDSPEFYARLEIYILEFDNPFTIIVWRLELCTRF